MKWDENVPFMWDLLQLKLKKKLKYKSSKAYDFQRNVSIFKKQLV